MNHLVLLLAVALAAVAALGWGCYRLLVDRGHLLLRLEDVAESRPPRVPPGLPPGAFLNDFALPALDGRTVTLSDWEGTRLLLVVLRPACLFSRAFARELRDRKPSPGSPLPVLLITGDVDDPDLLAVFTGLPGVLALDRDRQMARLLRVQMTPAGYLVDERRHTTSPLLAGPEALLAAARGEMDASNAKGDIIPVAMTILEADPARGPGLVPLGPGDAAPDLTLPLLGGGMWSLRAHRGRTVSVLFSDPGCPPCQEVLAKLSGVCDDRLVIVSRRSAIETDSSAGAMDMDVSIALQHGREAARAFGTLQTPAAFAIDAAGTIVAGPGIGVADALAVIHGTGADLPHSVTPSEEQGGATHE